jgi:3-mercaptopyruvate sulfurtransferase SseA
MSVARCLGYVCAALAMSLAVSGCNRETRDTDIRIISVSEAKNLFDRVNRGEPGIALFLDPRPAAEFNTGHIPGARNFTLAQIKPTARVDPRIDRFKNLVVYGDNPASATARGLTKRLIAVGYDDVRFFAGGIEEWAGRGYPVSTVPTPEPEGTDRPDQDAPASP